ncbi:cytidylyltransferase domain-containing protein [Clostridium scatologenes]|uniref:Acylneuraminate cytidylyltransferase n=1 Tax=Clostridium scatologenes TaxID=1548 RepID=A0A0E3JPK9_CLOSL|nr:glycosyltransferase family protein [Clostridium scatologenes]AKA70310.1 acylneuraminate cytidylyltransferase [Clostridium scatologenes]
MNGIYVIVQARVSSSRFYRKVLKEIFHKPILWHVVNRVKKSKYVSKVIVATTINKEDDEIYDYCIENNIEVFRGSSEDVLDRYYKCSKEFKCDTVVRITADCPLHDARVIDKSIDTYLQGNYDYVSNTLSEYTYPDGLDVEVFSFKTLEEAWKNANLSSEREHVTPYIKKNEKYRKFNVYADKKYPIYRLTLDCIEDYKLIQAIYEGIGKVDFSLDETVEFLRNNVELLKLNEQYGINEGYEKSLKNDKIVKF